MRWSWSEWLAVVIFALFLTRFVVAYPLIVGPIVFVTGLAMAVSAVRERQRRKKEDYYVDTLGGAEDGTVNYHEDGRELQLYYDRRKDTIYVPTDAKWNEIMPRWAGDRKHEIVSRIRRRVGKRLIGKSSTYQETDDSSCFMSQSLMK
jgi:hypothetical protein